MTFQFRFQKILEFFGIPLGNETLGSKLRLNFVEISEESRREGIPVLGGGNGTKGKG